MFLLGRPSSVILLVLVSIHLFFGCCIASDQNDLTAIIRIPGDLDILAILNYRENVVDSLQCTGPYNHRVAYDVEALRFAIEDANNATGNRFGISLGLTVVDACANPVIAIRETSAALSGTVTGLTPTGPTVGILVPGTDDDVTQLIAEHISQRLGITTIGYMPAEDRDDVNDILTSAVPLTSEASVLTMILTYAKWFNVGLLYSGYGSGPSRKDAFKKLAGDVGICVSYDQSIPYGLTQTMADDIVSDLVSTNQDIQVLVWIVNPDDIKLILRSMRLTGKQFNNVGSSAWQNALRENILDYDLLQEANSTIFIDDVTYDVNTDYEAYISQLDFKKAAQNNPWLNRTIIEGSININTTLIASHTSSLIRAVKMISSGINFALNQTCNDNATNDCLANFLEAPPSRSIYDAIKTSSVEEITKMYRVLVLDSPNPVEAGSVTTRTDRANYADFALTVNNEVYRSDNCLCFSIGLQERAMNTSTNTLWAYGFADPWIPAVFVVSLVFGLYAVVMFVCLLILRRYSVSKKSAYWANLLLLLGIMMMYFINVIYIRVPSELACGFRQFGTAFIYAWVFAALLVKCFATLVTLDHQGAYTVQSTAMTNKLAPHFQCSAFVAFLAPQIAISVQWIIFSPPRVITDPDVCGPGATECNVSSLQIVLSMMYVFVLVVLTFALSLARINNARLIQESRSLFLSSLSSVLLMVSWIIFFTIADPIYRTQAICVGVTVNATVILLSSFGPWCSVIVFGKGMKTAKVEEEHEYKDDDDEGHGDDIAYVNPAFLNNIDEATRL